MKGILSTTIDATCRPIGRPARVKPTGNDRAGTFKSVIAYVGRNLLVRLTPHTHAQVITHIAACRFRI